MLPTREQMKQVYARLQPHDVSPSFRVLKKSDMEQLKLSVYDFLEFPADIFDGMDGGDAVFMKKGLCSYIGISGREIA